MQNITFRRSWYLRILVLALSRNANIWHKTGKWKLTYDLVFSVQFVVWLFLSCWSCPEQHVSILVNSTWLTSHYDDCIRCHIYVYHLRQYIQGKQGWNNPVWKSVDFRLFGKQFKRLQPHIQVSRMNMVHGQLSLGARRLQQAVIDNQTLGLCPCCMQVQETSTHLLKCQRNLALSASLETLNKTMCQSHAHPFRHILAQSITHWALRTTERFSPLRSQFPLHFSEPIQEALDSQSAIGWDQASKGFLSKFWMDLLMILMTPGNKVDVTLGKQTMKQWISAIYDYTSCIWKTWNEQLHKTYI